MDVGRSTGKLYVLTFAFGRVFKIYFIYFERERERERERKRIPSRLCIVSTEPHAGLELTNCEIWSWAEVECLTD